MTDYFRPEFLGRLTEVVPFAPINEAIAREIFLLPFWVACKNSYKKRSRLV